MKIRVRKGVTTITVIISIITTILLLNVSVSLRRQRAYTLFYKCVTGACHLGSHQVTAGFVCCGYVGRQLREKLQTHFQPPRLLANRTARTLHSNMNIAHVNESSQWV